MLVGAAGTGLFHTAIGDIVTCSAGPVLVGSGRARRGLIFSRTADLACPTTGSTVFVIVGGAGLACLVETSCAFLGHTTIGNAITGRTNPVLIESGRTRRTFVLSLPTHFASYTTSGAGPVVLIRTLIARLICTGGTLFKHTAVLDVITRCADTVLVRSSGTSRGFVFKLTTHLASQTTGSRGSIMSASAGFAFLVDAATASFGNPAIRNVTTGCTFSILVRRG